MIPEQLKTRIEQDVRLLGDAWHILAGYMAGEVTTAKLYGMTTSQAEEVMSTYSEAKDWMRECQLKRRAELYPNAVQQESEAA